MSNSDSKGPKISLASYLSAAVLAATPVYIMAFLLTFIGLNDLIIAFTLLVVTSLLGGVISCYLLGKRFPGANEYISVVVGLAAYVVYTLFTYLAGSILLVNDFFIVVALIFGGALGMRLADRKKPKPVEASPQTG